MVVILADLLSWLDAKETSLLNTSKVIQEVYLLNRAGNKLIRYSTRTLVVVVIDSSICGILFGLFAGRLTLSMWLTALEV